MDLKAVRWTFAVCCFAAMTHNAEATFLTGNSIYAVCSDAGNLYVDNYVEGMADAVEAIKLEFPQIQICIPSGVVGRQLSDILCQKLRSMPDGRHLPAALIAVVAFHDAFPCAPK